MTTLGIVFILLVVFQVKHFLADFILQQNNYMLGKFKPGWGFFFPLLAHVAVHFVFTVLIATQMIAVFAPAALHWHGLIVSAWGIGLLDAIIHFIMDRLKAGPSYMGRWKPITAMEYSSHRAWASATDKECMESKFQGDWKRRAQAKEALLGNNLFWCSLGFDQMVHHLTHYGCIYLILLAARMI